MKMFIKKFEGKVGQMCHQRLVACIGFLYKVVHKIGRLRKFNRSRRHLLVLTAWTISMKFGTLVQHALGYKTVASDFLHFCTTDLVMVFQSRKKGVKSSLTL